MPGTLENHLTGVTLHAAHPESYRPDLPLVGEINAGRSLASEFERGRQAGYEKGHDKGYDEGYDDGYKTGDEAGAARVKRQAERPSA